MEKIIEKSNFQVWKMEDILFIIGEEKHTHFLQNWLWKNNFSGEIVELKVGYINVVQNGNVVNTHKVLENGAVK